MGHCAAPVPQNSVRPPPDIRYSIQSLLIIKSHLGSARLKLGTAQAVQKKDIKSNENDCSRTGGTIILNKIEKARKGNSKTFQLCISQNYIFEQRMQMFLAR